MGFCHPFQFLILGYRAKREVNKVSTMTTFQFLILGYALGGLVKTVYNAFLSIPHFRIQTQIVSEDHETINLFQFLILGYPSCSLPIELLSLTSFNSSF